MSASRSPEDIIAGELHDEHSPGEHGPPCVQCRVTASNIVSALRRHPSAVVTLFGSDIGRRPHSWPTGSTCTTWSWEQTRG